MTDKPESVTKIEERLTKHRDGTVTHEFVYTLGNGREVAVTGRCEDLYYIPTTEHDGIFDTPYDTAG